MNLVVSVNVPDPALGHLGFEGGCGGIDDYLGIARCPDKLDQIVGIFEAEGDLSGAKLDHPLIR
jgi:hypothetical protein